MSIVFVCCPKPFNELFSDIQNNAITSWLKLKETRNIVICGNEEGIESYALALQKKDNRVIYHPNVERNKFGTPLVNSLFSIGKQYTTDADYLCFINSDIIALNDFSKSVNAFKDKYPSQEKFLLIGQRWDWNKPEPIDFNNENWQDILKALALGNGKMHPESGIDYFLYSKKTFDFIYPFAVGKFWWDMWLVGNAFRRKDVMTVDITSTNFIVHQNTPWYQNGKPQTNAKAIWNTEEARINRSFDNYKKGIGEGTRYKTKMLDKEVVFHQK